MKKIITVLLFASLATMNFVQIFAQTSEISRLAAHINEQNRIVITGEIAPENQIVGITVKAPDGSYVYIDNKMSDGNDFTFISPVAGAQNGNYEITVRGEHTQLYTTQLYYEVSGENRIIGYSLNGAIGVFSGNNISVKMYDAPSLSQLAANFKLSDKSTVRVGNVVQISGITKNDFDSPVIYTVTAENGDEKTYVVSVTNIITEKGSGSGSGSGAGGSGTGSVKIAVPVSGEEDRAYVTPISTEYVGFTDIGDYEWAKKYIEKFYNEGIISGYGENTFQPERNITREEFVKILVSVFGFDKKDSHVEFKDVISDEWYAEFVSIAVANGIVSGISETEFGTGQYITRQDMAVMIRRSADALSKKLETASEFVVFSDDEYISDYAKEDVYFIQQAGIISGKGNGIFAPHDFANRAEAVKMLGSLAELILIQN